MTDFPFDAVGFDLDGTLLDTHRDLGEAVNHALREGGFEPVATDRIEALIGGGAKIMLQRAIADQGGLSDEEFRPLYKSLLRYYGENNAVHTRPYPGAEEALDQLASRGVTMAVVTNKFEGFARDILTQLDLIDRFATVIGGDSLGKDADGQYIAKPAPDPVLKAREACGGGRFVFIGDSSYDVDAARAAEVPVVAAAYGYCDKPADELGADAIARSFAEIVPLLERWGD